MLAKTAVGVIISQGGSRIFGSVLFEGHLKHGREAGTKYIAADGDRDGPL
jgi:hypothetical protein